MSWPWSELGLTGPCGAGEVKRAYAQKVKTAHPEEDPEGFQRLHRAYQAARQMAAHTGAAVPQSQESTFIDYEAIFTGSRPLEPEEDTPDAGSGEEIRFADYERLFAEGEAERKAARQRRAEKRLQEAQERRRAQEQRQRDLALEDEEAWSAALAALHALEVLWSSEASKEEWILFLHSSTFLNAQHNLDFIFGLEDFLAEHPWLPDEVKRHMYLTYKFYNGKPDAPYLGLYRILQENSGRTGKRLKIPWRKRVFREERAPLLLLWVLLAVIFIDFFFLSGAGRRNAPPVVVNSVEVSQKGSADTAAPPEDPDEAGIESAKKLATALAAEDFPGLYVLSGAGLSTSQEDGHEKFYWAQCTGQTEGGETLVMNYFLTADGSRVYCIPEEKNTGDRILVEQTGATYAGGKTVEIYRCAAP